MAEYYTENFESYANLFAVHTGYICELMKMLDDEIIGIGLPPVGKSKDLFSMAVELCYSVDISYKKEHKLDETDFKLTTYMIKDEFIASMRSLLREELNCYLGSNNGTEQS